MRRQHVKFLTNFNQTGVGRHCENAYFAMMRARPRGMTLEYVDSINGEAVRQAITSARADIDTTVFFARVPREVVESFPGRRILWWFFESDSLPPSWLDQLRPFDQIWAPSPWARDVLLAHGIEAAKLRLVESGFHDAIFHPAESGAPRTSAGFTFLSVGKYENRKSIDEVISAFLDVFPASAHPGVALWLKADYPLFPQRVQELAARLAHDRRIRVVSGHLSDEQMADLYRSADAFVFPSKAEGFGLPCLEALACGLPTIVTAVTAQRAFLDPIEGLYCPVQFNMAAIEDADYRLFYGGEYGSHPLGTWAIPDMESLRQCLKEVYKNHDRWRERGREAAKRLQERFSWDAIGQRAVQSLQGGA